MLRYVDGQRGIVEEQAKVRATKSGIEGLRAIIDRQARWNPDYKPLADAFDLLRRQDPAAQQAWQDRQDDRLAGCRAIVARIEAEGRLRPGLDPALAADLIWTTTSIETWDDLVAKRGWSAADYRTWMAELLLSSVTVPRDPGRGRIMRRIESFACVVAARQRASTARPAQPACYPWHDSLFPCSIRSRH